MAFGFNQTETTPSTSRNSNFSYAYISNIEDWSGKIDVDWMPNPDHLVKFGVGDIYHTFTRVLINFNFFKLDRTLWTLHLVLNCIMPMKFQLMPKMIGK